MAQLSQYVNRQEWLELATGVNFAQRRHAATSNGLVMGLLFGTCAICFCPLMCYHSFVDVEGRVNEDIENLPITQRLKARGITLHCTPKTGKFSFGGLTCHISAKTPAAPPG